MRGPALIVTLAAVVGLAALAGAATAAPSDVSWRTFQTPSQNILCVFGTRGGPHIYCRANDPGISLTLYERGRVKRGTLCDPHPAHYARQLDYGMGWRRGHLRCESRLAALRCWSTLSGSWFSLSRESVSTGGSCG